MALHPTAGLPPNIDTVANAIPYLNARSGWSTAVVVSPNGGPGGDGGDFGRNTPSTSTCGIQEAINQLGVSGGTIVLRPGTYPYLVPIAIPHNHIRITGAGSGATVLQPQNDTDCFDISPGVSHVTIEHLSIYDGLGKTTHGWAVYLNSSSGGGIGGVRVLHLEIHYANGIGADGTKLVINCRYEDLNIVLTSSAGVGIATGAVGKTTLFSDSFISNIKLLGPGATGGSIGFAFPANPLGYGLMVTGITGGGVTTGIDFEGCPLVHLADIHLEKCTNVFQFGGALGVGVQMTNGSGTNGSNATINVKPGTTGSILLVNFFDLGGSAYSVKFNDSPAVTFQWIGGQTLWTIKGTGFISGLPAIVPRKPSLIAHVSGFSPCGYALPTPAVPGSGTGWRNPYPWITRLEVLTANSGTYTITDAYGNTGSAVPAVAGSIIRLHPGETVTPTYVGLTWRAYGE